MSISITMHFDGKVFIPDQPVDVPVNEPIRADLYVPDVRLTTEEIARRRAAWKRASERAVKGANIPLEALRRVNMDDLDRGL